VHIYGLIIVIRSVTSGESTPERRPLVARRPSGLRSSNQTWSHDRKHARSQGLDSRFRSGGNSNVRLGNCVAVCGGSLLVDRDRILI
jgi:hypothetical protein